MANSLAVVETRTLAELGEAASTEFAEAKRAATRTVECWVRMGEAFNEARRLLDMEGSAGFRAWVERETEVPYASAAPAMRMAHYQDKVLSAGSLLEAQNRLVGLPPIGLKGAQQSRRRELEPTAQRMREDGATYSEIGAALGVTGPTIWTWLHPNTRKDRWAEQRRKQAEERQIRRERQVRKIGGPVAESYSRLRKTLDAVQAACDDAPDQEVRVAMRAAMSRLHAAEDEILSVLGIA